VPAGAESSGVALPGDEGKVYDTIDAKVAAIEAELQDWDADPDRVRRLVSWPWIMDTLNQLPGPGTSAA
jgi:hypothetical protein